VTAERLAQCVLPRLAGQRQFPVALHLAQPEKKMRREGRDGDAEKTGPDPEDEQRKHHQNDGERIKNARVHCLNRHRRT
jgi:hypothetical protein